MSSALAWKWMYYVPFQTEVPRHAGHRSPWRHGSLPSLPAHLDTSLRLGSAGCGNAGNRQKYWRVAEISASISTATVLLLESYDMILKTFIKLEKLYNV